MEDRKEYYEKITKEETFAAYRLSQWVEAALKPKSMIDFGAATGLYLKPYSCHALGLERDVEALRRRVINNVVQADLTERCLFFGCYDVGLCLEVLEHIQEPLLPTVMENISRHQCRALIFSAANPLQVEEGHVTLKPRMWWIDQWDAFGFRVEQELTKEMLAYVSAGYHMGWFVQNAVVLTPKR